MIEEKHEEKIHGRIAAEVFGSLSSAELIILWSARQYTDILYLMDCIRDFTIRDDREMELPELEQPLYSLFRTTYTMISFPDLFSREGVNNHALSEIKGHAHVQFVMQDGTGEKDIALFEEFVKQCMKNAGKMIGAGDPEEIRLRLNRCAGEYDLIGYISSKYVARLFVNPETWHEEGWKLDPEDPEHYFCSVHHPKYNQYVLYSFTRLGYTEEDLPAFTAEPDNDKSEWNRKKKVLSRSSLQAVSKVYGELNRHRSELIRRIQNDYKIRFRKLISLVSTSIPSISNLATELNQMFSDYVQCCSSCADYLWIEDYNELFIQVLERIEKSVKEITIWDNRIKKEEVGGKLSEWKTAKGRLDNIRELINSLNQHTNHISASNKLFFREQMTHFGYTAQHDLVIHAYYDIIKRLIRDIYSYTDNSVQSRLYPIVYFHSDDRITSKIYVEESEQDYRKESLTGGGMDMPSRIMVIHIPIDGMDNLLHYLPMVVHEVYHYASPKDRRLRNRILAKAVTFQVLRTSLSQAFMEQAAACPGITSMEQQRQIEKQFQNLIDPVLYKVVNAKEEAIYAGIIFNLRDSETEDKYVIPEKRILRNWFLVRMTNWLNDCKSREEKVSHTELGQKVLMNYSDIFHEVLAELITELDRTVKSPNIDASVSSKIYKKLLLSLTERVKTAIGELESKDPDLVLAPDSLIQRMGELSYKYVTENRNLNKLLEQFDELFPDIAMAAYTRMPASGYMLQVALDLDKQLMNGSEFETDQIRFSTVIKHLLYKEGMSREEEIRSFKRELERFRKMYVSAYRNMSVNLEDEDIDEWEKEHKKKAFIRAEKWVAVFDAMYMSRDINLGPASFCYIYFFVEELVSDMKECLPGSGTEEKIVRDRLFAEPYNRYLRILEEMEPQKQQDELFGLSISLIQEFQNSYTLKSINSEFAAAKSAYVTGKKTAAVKVSRLLSIPYETRIFVPEAYFTAVEQALYMLYLFREEDRVIETSGMWFRGVSSIKYPVLPSGLVHYSEDAARMKKGFPDDSCFCSYAKVQLHNYESFRYSAEGSDTGVDPSRYYHTVNYLALMQHYAQHTNFLDWSEDYFGSSYFALEDEININDKYEYERGKDHNYRTANDDAVMYILDPVRFNKACTEIESKVHGAEVPLYNLVSMEIPNLSIKDNQEDYREYHDIYNSKMKSDKIIRVKAAAAEDTKKPVSLKKLLEDETFPKKELKLPRAIYTAKLNARIRAQSGLFVAFDLGSIPVDWEGKKVATERPNTDLFNYQALETIQKYYMEEMHKLPFMMKIRISKSIKKELGTLLYKCGISKEKIYPQLDNYRRR